MSNARARKLLLLAFLLSVLIHLVFLAKLEWPFAVPRDEEQAIQHVSIMRVARRVPPPRPPQTPPPTPVPHASAAARSSAPPARSLHGLTPGSGTGGSAPPTAAPTALPSVAPAASATPSCAKNDIPVQLTTAPTPPDIAPDARASATNGKTLVRVEVDASGVVTGAQVVGSSGNTSLDVVALSLAKSAQYSPALHDCKAVAGTYVFTTSFAVIF